RDVHDRERALLRGHNRAAHDARVHAGRRRDREAVGGKAGARHAILPTTTASNEAATNNCPTVSARVTRGRARSRRATRTRNACGVNVRAIIRTGSARTSPNVAPTTSPAANEPAPSAQTNAIHVTEPATIVANASPSGPPKPAP